MASASWARGLIELELRVAMIEFADHLALLHCAPTSTGVDDNASGDGGRDVGAFIGNEGSGLFEAGWDLTLLDDCCRYCHGLTAPGEIAWTVGCFDPQPALSSAISVSTVADIFISSSSFFLRF